jgi:large conductance mechanosensitive channel
MKTFINEFKEFAIKGNVVDLAVAVIIGGAFRAIITSLVDDIIMPIVAAVFSIPDFSELSMAVNGTPIMIGLFIQAIINFLIVALTIFLVVKLIIRMKKKEEVPAASPIPTTEEILLTEIRDLLKEK